MSSFYNLNFMGALNLLSLMIIKEWSELKKFKVARIQSQINLVRIIDNSASYSLSMTTRVT